VTVHILPALFRSLAYRFTYRNAKKTLTDEVVEKMHTRIVQRLTQELSAEIAGGKQERRSPHRRGEGGATKVRGS